MTGPGESLMRCRDLDALEVGGVQHDDRRGDVLPEAGPATVPLRVPGIGTTSSPRARNQARVSCAAVTPVSAAMACTSLVEVDDVDAQPPQGRVACAAHVPRAPVDRSGAVVLAHVAELRREDDLLTPSPGSVTTGCSLVCGPYLSVVSSSVTPRSSARCSVATD